MIKMTKDDQNAFVTNKTLGEAVDTILEGMDNMLEEQKKIFATKDDLRNVKQEIKSLATKEDLNTEISWVRDDIKGLTGELSETVTRKEFNELESKVDKFFAS